MFNLCSCETCSSFKDRIKLLTEALVIKECNSITNEPGSFNGMTKEQIQSEIDIAKESLYLVIHEEII